MRLVWWKNIERGLKDTVREITQQTQGLFSKKRGFPAKQQKSIFSSVSVGYLSQSPEVKLDFCCAEHIGNRLIFLFAINATSRIKFILRNLNRFTYLKKSFNFADSNFYQNLTSFSVSHKETETTS